MFNTLIQIKHLLIIDKYQRCLSRVSKFRRFDVLKLNDLYVGEGNVRVENAQQDIDMLAEHIYVNGLLEPIVVFAVNDIPEENVEIYESRRMNEGKYEILAGQRRFAAFKQLNEETPRKRLRQNSMSCS